MSITKEQREAWRNEDVIEYALDPHLARTRILALLAALDAAEAKVAEGQEHIAYHLRDFRPRADMAATGDLAVDMVAYADRLKARAELAESERDEAVAKVARVSALAADLTSDDCELYDEPEWDCITAGPQVLAVDGCLPCRLRAALAGPSPTETVEGVGTGAGRGGDPASTEATLRVNGSVDCPEAPAQAHLLDTPATEGGE